MKPFFTALLTTFFALSSHAKTFDIYLDADQSINKESGASIFMGLDLAFQTINYTIDGHTFRIIKKDHHSNVSRTKKHLLEFTENPNALAVFGGMHSSNILRNQTFINEQKIPIFIPWAAASPITRPKTNENWIFRLSVDDSKAGKKLTEFALKEKHCKNPALVLENTPWGQANEKTITTAFQNETVKPKFTHKFSWGLNENDTLKIAEKVKTNNVDCILLVANASEGSKITTAIANASPQTKIISHWGITGGNFAESTNLSATDISFIQTCFSFNNPEQTSTDIWQKIQAYNPNIKTADDLHAPVGFIHAYDLANIVIHHLKKIDLNENIKKIRADLKTSLENTPINYNGLIKNYKQPFTNYTTMTPDAHEALGAEDFCMAKYNKNLGIELINRQ